MADLNAIRAAAMAAAKVQSAWVYCHNYVGGARVIATREPTGHTRSLTCIRSPAYAKVRGCSLAVARRELSRLVEWQQIREAPGCSGMRDWRLLDRDAERLGIEVIAELRAQGLPFEDEWRAAGSPNTWPPAKEAAACA